MCFRGTFVREAFVQRGFCPDGLLFVHCSSSRCQNLENAREKWETPSSAPSPAPSSAPFPAPSSAPSSAPSPAPSSAPSSAQLSSIFSVFIVVFTYYLTGRHFVLFSFSTNAYVRTHETTRDTRNEIFLVVENCKKA